MHLGKDFDIPHGAMMQRVNKVKIHRFDGMDHAFQIVNAENRQRANNDARPQLMIAEMLLKSQVEIPVKAGHAEDMILEHKDWYDGPNGIGVYSIYGPDLPFVSRKRRRDAVSKLLAAIRELPVHLLQEDLGVAGVARVPRQESSLVFAGHEDSSLNQDAVKGFRHGAGKLGRREVADREVGLHVLE